MMRVVLSRKGLDTSFGSNAGNMLLFNEDKTKAQLIMLPIPELDSRNDYCELSDYWREYGDSDKFLKFFDNYKFLGQYYPLSRTANRLEKCSLEIKDGEYCLARCHPDPNINNFYMKKDFLGSLGQVGQAQSHLANEKNKIGVGDIFIFFGLFNECIDKGATINLDSKQKKHIMFGYLQVGNIIRTNEFYDERLKPNKEKIKYYQEKYPFILDNPHWDWWYDEEYWPDFGPKPNPFPPKYRARKKHYCVDKTNCIYIARPTCTFDESIKGFGMFKYKEDLILTKNEENSKECRPTHWNLPKEVQGLDITYHSKNSQKEKYFQAASRGQEFVIEDCPQAEQWAINLIKSHQ